MREIGSLQVHTGYLTFSLKKLLTVLRINAKYAGTRKYLRGIGNLCSSEAYNQGRLTLIF